MSVTTTTDFIETIFDPADQFIEVRCIDPTLPADQRDKVRSSWHTFAQLIDLDLDRLNVERCVYVGINPRTGRVKGDANVKTIRNVWADFDGGIDWPEAHRRIEDAGLPHPSAVVASGGGVHVYWRLDDEIDAATFTATQKGIAATLDSDKIIHNPERIMRTPGSINRKPKRNGAACYVIEANDDRHDIADIVTRIQMPEPEESPNTEGVTDWTDAEIGSNAIPDGERNGTLFQIACSMRGKRALREPWILEELREINRDRCKPPLDDDELKTIATQAAKYDDAVEIDAPIETAWGTPGNIADLIGTGTPDLRQKVAQGDTAPDAKTPLSGYLTGATLAEGFTTGLADGFGFNAVDTSFLNAPGTPQDSRILLGPGMVSLFGGAPGAGKSALVEQIAWHLAKNDPSFRILIANVELSPWMLMARQIQRCTEIPAKSILSGHLNADELAVVQNHAARLTPFLDRVAIIPHVSTIADVAKAAGEFGANLIILDYIQRIQGDEKADTRESLNKAMGAMRRAADGGRAVLAVSALSRSKGTSGSNYANSTSLASFRESSEVEYGADFACILTPDERQAGAVRVGVVKNRWGELGSYGAMFDGPSLTWSIGTDVYGGNE